ncbi:MAG: ABC transporter permease [Armatimonadota bacterium]|nr:ABC transporter permease [Armatimonadota bacterium]
MAAQSPALPAAPWSPPRRQASLRYFLHRYARNRMALFGLWVITLVAFAAVFAPRVAPADPTKPDFGRLLAPASREHLLGTYDLGRDLLSRVIYGARTSLLAGVVSVGIAVAVGLPLGLMSGYYRGRLDDFLMRLTDALLSFPFLVLALAIAAVLGAGLWKAMIAIGIVFTPGFIRLSRAQVLSERERAYVEAARARRARRTGGSSGGTSCPTASRRCWCRRRWPWPQRSPRRPR